MTEPVRVRRLVYPGAPISGVATIKGMSVVKSTGDVNMQVVQVPSLAHYGSGCRSHASCFGHLCSTPSGAMLPPQSLSMRNGDITTEYLNASKLAFNNKHKEYMSALERTNFTKNGTMRSIMSTPVAGSARLIATPMWYRRDVVFVSQNLASKLKSCYVHVYADGTADPLYRERTLSEGDTVFVVRPPSLNIWNVQPMKVRFWNNDCIGIHPETFSRFHGDFDGDEAHIIPVYSPAALAECNSWTVPYNDAFVRGRAEYALRNSMRTTDTDYDNKCDYMNTTTVSSLQMTLQKQVVAYGNVSRNKDSNLKAMHERFNSTATETDFVAQSIRGTKDVCRQQLSQGLIGDMTRVAKIAAMCFFRSSTGTLCVSSRSGIATLVRDDVTDPGYPAVRAVMSLCEVAQQAALDAHRVQESSIPSHDFVSDIILCRPVLAPSSTKLPTMVLFDQDVPSHLLHSLDLKWKYVIDSHLAVLCNPSRVTGAHVVYITGSYNPIVLAKCEAVRDNVVSVCMLALTVVCNYYNVQLTDLELNDLSHVLTYKTSNSTSPITTRAGMTARNLGWIETLEGTDVNAISTLTGHFEEPHNSTSAVFMHNFSHITNRLMVRTPETS